MEKKREKKELTQVSTSLWNYSWAHHFPTLAFWRFKSLHYHHEKVKALVTKPCPTHDPMGCSLPGSSVHGISQARMLEWVAIPFSRRSSWPRDQIQVACIVGRFFTCLQITYHVPATVLSTLWQLISFSLLNNTMKCMLFLFPFYR